MKKLILCVLMTLPCGIAMGQTPYLVTQPNHPAGYGSTPLIQSQYKQAPVATQASQAMQRTSFNNGFLPGHPYGYGACPPNCSPHGCALGQCEGACGPGKICVTEVGKKKVTTNHYTCKIDWFCIPKCSCFSGCGNPCGQGCDPCLECCTRTKRVLMKLITTEEIPAMVCVLKDCGPTAPPVELIPAPIKK